MDSPLGRSVIITVVFIIVLCSIEILDRWLQLDLYRFGIYPRSPGNFVNIAFAPLIHGSWNHLLSNSATLLILLATLLYAYPRSAIPVLLLIYLGSGIGVWLFARESYHYGASGLTHGIMFFIFISGILRRDRQSIALAMIVFFLYGGMIWTIFPQEPGISFESHFFGAASGVLGAFIFNRFDPRPAEKKYDWEDEVSDVAEPQSPEDGDS